MNAEFVEKVHRLLAENRVALVAGYENKAAVVCGFSGWWLVKARPEGLECDCPAGQAEWCSHRAAAAVVWADELANDFNPAVAA